MTQTDIKAVKQEETIQIHAEPSEFNKKIGTITYVVAVYSSRTSEETFEDKVLRLIESEVREIA